MSFIKTLSLIGLVLSLTACNTVKGIGQDIQKTDEKIENSAKK